MTEVNQPMMIIRKRLSADEVSNPRLRYNATTDEMESTPDGGTTWNPAPGEDPRHADSFRLPPLSGPDAACDAAARITAELQEALAILLQDAAAAVVVTNILGVLLLLTGPIGWAIDLAFAVLGTIAAIGTVAIAAAFTSTVWDEIECIIYCHIGSDGQMSQAQADEIYAEIFANYSGTISGTYLQLNRLFGEVNFSNAGVERTETGDCDECACEWIAYQDYTVAPGDFVPGESGVDWIEGLGWRSKNFGGNNCEDVYGHTPLDLTAITYAAGTFNRSCDIGGGNVSMVFRLKNGGFTQAQYANVPGVCGNPVTLELTDAVTIDDIYIDVNSGTSCGLSYLQRFELRGTGTPPTGWTLA